MPQSLSNVLIHMVFSTKDWNEWIDETIEPELWAYLTAVCRGCSCPTIHVGGANNHIHILARLSRTTTISGLFEEVKKRSSHWIKTRSPAYKEFCWQSGYGSFSIGQSGVDGLVRYIQGQKEHHRKVTFQEEFRSLLSKYNVDYDERYVWD